MNTSGPLKYLELAGSIQESAVMFIVMPIPLWCGECYVRHYVVRCFVTVPMLVFRIHVTTLAGQSVRQLRLESVAESWLKNACHLGGQDKGATMILRKCFYHRYLIYLDSSCFTWSVNKSVPLSKKGYKLVLHCTLHTGGWCVPISQSIGQLQSSFGKGTKTYGRA